MKLAQFHMFTECSVKLARILNLFLINVNTVLKGEYLQKKRGVTMVKIILVFVNKCFLLLPTIREGPFRPDYTSCSFRLTILSY